MNLDHAAPYFNLTVAGCRRVGRLGGRARARNLRTARAAHPAMVAAADQPVLPHETTHEACLLLDARFPWLIGAERRAS